MLFTIILAKGLIALSDMIASILSSENIQIAGLQLKTALC
jgi:hypothetical protein